MYTYTSTSSFLVLSPTEHGPDTGINLNQPANKFLVLSPTESGPDASVNIDQSQYDCNSISRARSDSSSSDGSQLKGTFSPLPGGFLYLGHPAPVRTASSE